MPRATVNSMVYNILWPFRCCTLLSLNVLQRSAKLGTVSMRCLVIALNRFKPKYTKYRYLYGISRKRQVFSFSAKDFKGHCKNILCGAFEKIVRNQAWILIVTKLSQRYKNVFINIFSHKIIIFHGPVKKYKIYITNK